MTRKAGNFVLLISLVISVLLSLLFGYLWIDRSISLAYSTDSISALSESRQHLVQILKTDWNGLTIGNVEQKLRACARSSPDFPTLSPLQTEDQKSIFRLGDLEFEFVDGHLRNIK